MHFASIELRNWGPFRGEHFLELGPGEFGVTGEWEHAPDRRSNYSGKSRLLAAMHFLITGRRPKEDDYEGDWVSEGESSGGVVGILADASGEPVLKIRRERHGSSPKLLAARPGEDPAAQDAAQGLIETVVGLYPTDLFATWFARQKEIDRFVVSKDARDSILEDWFPELGKLRVAEESVKIGKATDALAAARVRLTEAARDPALSYDLEELRLVLVRRKDDRSHLDRQIVEASKEYEDAVRLREVRRAAADRSEALARDKARHVELQVEIATLEKEIAATPETTGDVRDTEAKAGAEKARAEDEAETARRVARGEFDGACPVSGGPCPVRDEINRSGEAGRRRLTLAEESLKGARSAYQGAVEASRGERAREREIARLRGSLEALRGEAAATAKRVEAAWASGVRPPDPSLPGETGDPAEAPAVRWRALQAEEDEVRLEISGLEQQIGRTLEARKRHTECEAAVREAEKTVEVRRLARLVLGAGGAQRDFVAGRLGRIEVAANAVLREAGIDQDVGLRWGRPIQGLETHCAACGHPYPKRQGARECERCGAERGPKFAQELDLRVRHRSGGGDDLAGIVVRIGAAAWLTARRGSPWSSLIVDEPHGALDAEHRDAVHRIFSGLARGMLGVKAEQVIVVSHSPEVISRMARRIVVTRGATGSSVRVM